MAYDAVKTAKEIASITKLPLPRVAAILQKYPIEKGGKIDAAQAEKAMTEWERAAAAEMRKLMAKLF